ncbi:MAG TPA: orotate phosphoribosyltransferase, partial [Thermoplasmatales archaeon]|nr:orotate phosphoribosyltransferase [Thermoplasmatales archaeon]
MELMGLCQICGRPGARYTCILCGSIVCSNCFDAKHGVCIRCKN